MENKDIRKAIEDSGLKHWQVAEALRIHEGSFSRQLRRELDEARKREVFQAIEKAKLAL
ncbi:hypothetical protein [Sporosarcina limicola]|uniref:XRE-type DNA-binding protein n=1 Tax=Sporosarcina limicola TaxID=34101 RepID=A0A927R374_9BACL|nr:hypothetical protein [Sporosarcina limicola]MBE1554761.1 putative XRE-type DNA-binding protein [Sporosarcina limicola]